MKKYLLESLILVLLFIFCACGSENDNPVHTNTTVLDNTPIVDTTTAPNPIDEVENTDSTSSAITSATPDVSETVLPTGNTQPTATPSVKTDTTQTAPTQKATENPTAQTTVKPTTQLTPTVKPTVKPTVALTAKPTTVSTATPTVKPTPVPTAQPTPTVPLYDDAKAQSWVDFAEEYAASIGLKVYDAKEEAKDLVASGIDKLPDGEDWDGDSWRYILANHSCWDNPLSMYSRLPQWLVEENIKGRLSGYVDEGMKSVSIWYTKYSEDPRFNWFPADSTPDYYKLYIAYGD